MRPHGRRQGAEEPRKVGVVKIADGTAEKYKQAWQIFIDGAEAFFVARVQSVKCYLRKVGAHGVAGRQ